MPMKNSLRRLFTAGLLLALSACNPDATPPVLTADEAPENRIDLIILGDYVVSMDESGSVYENGAVAVDDGVILAVGSAAEITTA